MHTKLIQKLAELPGDLSASDGQSPSPRSDVRGAGTHRVRLRREKLMRVTMSSQSRAFRWEVIEDSTTLLELLVFRESSPSRSVSAV